MTVQRLIMDLKVGQSLTIDGGIVVTLEAKSGQLAKLRFEHRGADIRRTPDRRSEPRSEYPGRRATDVSAA